METETGICSIILVELLFEFTRHDHDIDIVNLSRYDFKNVQFV